MSETVIERLRRKRDQAWEMAGLARQDGDEADCIRRMEEAKEYSRLIAEELKISKILA